MSGALVWFGVGLLGAAGALSRFLLDSAVGQRLRSSLPYGTLAVNATGAFALGIIVGAALEGDAQRLAGTGFLGAYTTFSTWVFESYRLGEDGEVRVAALNIAVSLAIGITLALVGRHIGAAL